MQIQPSFETYSKIYRKIRWKFKISKLKHPTKAHVYNLGRMIACCRRVALDQSIYWESKLLFADPV
jgi:hypothetical protein